MRFNRYFIIALLFPFFIQCDLSLKLDKTPPTCHIVSPTDSARVSGIVAVEVEAFDSSGIAAVLFFADGLLFALDSTPSFIGEWDTGLLPESSWHQLYCIAIDSIGNKGFSDTVNVMVTNTISRNLFYGQIILPDHYYRRVDFNADNGNTLSGDTRDILNGKISKFYLSVHRMPNLRSTRRYS